MVPTSVTDVTIAAPPAGGQAPVLDVAAAVHSLTVESGALLDLGSRTITVEGTVTNNGTLKQTKDVAPGTSRFLTITDAAGLTGKYWGIDIMTSNSLHATTVAISGNQFCRPSLTRQCGVVSTSALKFNKLRPSHSTIVKPKPTTT